MTGIILAGGKSIRFGKDKVLLKIGKKTIIETIINKFESIFDETLIVTNNFALFDKLSNYPINVTCDIIDNKGSLGGLYSGLVNSKSEYNFVVACDMPFLNVELIRYMKNNCNGFDITVPKLQTRYETLHAVYSKNCIKYIEKQLKNDNLKINAFFKYVKIKEVTVKTVKKFDKNLLSFFNVNTPYAYRKALKMALDLNLSSVYF